MKELIKHFILPKELRWKAVWYILYHASCLYAIVFASTAICDLWLRILIPITMIIWYAGSQSLFFSITFKDKLRYFIGYIFTTNAMFVVATTVVTLMLLQRYPIWIMIAILVLVVVVSSYWTLACIKQSHKKPKSQLRGEWIKVGNREVHTILIEDEEEK